MRVRVAPIGMGDHQRMQLIGATLVTLLGTLMVTLLGTLTVTLLGAMVVTLRI